MPRFGEDPAAMLLSPFITVYHRFLFFSVMPFLKEKESSTGDEQ
jgi:hypothetical protein